MDALRPLWDAERPGLHSHAEHGNDQYALKPSAVRSNPDQQPRLKHRKRH